MGRVSQYEVYDATGDDVPWELREDPAPVDLDEVDGEWFVAIEYSNAGQAKPPTVVAIAGPGYVTREEALAAAGQEAFNFDPPDPFSPQGRQVYRDGPDGYLVMIDGAMSRFHMSVRVVQQVGEV